MPREGYRSITLPNALYRELQRKAGLYGTSPQKALEMLLEDPSKLPVLDETFSEKVSEGPVRPTIKLFCLLLMAWLKKRPFMHGRSCGRGCC